jgi:hypothetical protein
LPAVTLSLTGFHRKLNENLTTEQKTRTLEEIRPLSRWDAIARDWMRDAPSMRGVAFLNLIRKVDQFAKFLAVVIPVGGRPAVLCR